MKIFRVEDDQGKTMKTGYKTIIQAYDAIRRWVDHIYGYSGDGISEMFVNTSQGSFHIIEMQILGEGEIEP